MADQSRKLEIRVGVVTIIAVIALIGGILWGKGIGIDRRRLTIQLENASGLTSGTPVLVSGVPKGGVASIKTVEDGAHVEILVDRDVKVMEDASAVIRVMEITGGKKIELDPGESSRPLPDDAEIPGLNQGDVGAMLAFVGNLAHDIAPMLRRLDSTLVAVNDIVGDEAFREDVVQTLDNFSSLSADLRSLVRNNRGRIERTLNNVDALAANLRGVADRNAPVVERLLTNTESLVNDARGTLGGADATLATVDRLALRIDSIAVELRTGEGMISRLLYDPEMASELEKVLVELRKTLRDLNQKGVNVNMEVGHKH